MERVSPRPGSNSRVSCSIAPPSSMISICRRASCSIAWPMKRIEFTFLISQRVPSGSPGLRTETLTSARKRALLHVAVAGAEIAQDRAQLGEERHRLLGRAQIGLRHDLHQRHAGAVEIDAAHVRMLVVQRLAGVLLEMQPLDADRDGLAALEIDDHLALADDRLLVLADLVALRQVGIEIVLAVEHRLPVDLRLQPEPGADRLPHAFLVDHRQHAGHGGVDQRDMAVGRAAELGRGAGEQLRLAR